MAGTLGSLCRVLQRRRVYEPAQLDQGNLRRCLSVWDLTALGVGSSLGVGVYVLIGSVALHLAGPSIVLSFLIAAVAAIFAGMCYAEFGARVPKAGSAYVYAYVTVGEFVAFVIGWDMILEAVFGTASVARGLSMYVDSMTNSSMSAWLTSAAPISSPHLSPYFDLFSFLVVMLLGVLLALGVRESSMVNNVFTGVNLLVIVFVIFAGAFKADLNNWSIPEADVPENRGVGGFFPYGIWGMLKGAAVCFYGFVGFDSISSTGEEVRDPRRAIPLSIMSTQVIVFVVYAGVATVVTMMMPYYLQEKVASIATSFSYVGWDWARWFVTVGAILGITASLYGGMFPLTRLLYSMASDGLLFPWLAKVTVKRKSPIIATILSAIVIALLAAILELNELILMMCVGTLLSYTIVASCVIILRYRSEEPPAGSGLAKQIFGLGGRSATRNTSCIINTSLLLYVCTCFTTAVVGHHAAEPVPYVSALHAIGLVLIVIMTLQPQVREELTFKTPLVPIIPCLSIYVNINLMVLIKVETWIRVLIWIAIGIPVYIFCVCCYKQRNEENLEDSINSSKANVNGKSPVQIYVVSPTPPDTIRRSYHGEEALQDDEIAEVSLQEYFTKDQPIIIEQKIVQHAYVEDNEEKEAKIIDLLDQVLQAEEDSYGEIISLKEQKEDETTEEENDAHRKSLSELSDAGSEASVGNQVLSKYDVIAQVHREDLPKLDEEEEKSEKEEAEFKDYDAHTMDEEVTAFNDSDSRTDESGYSDTIDKTALNESVEDFKEDTDIPHIPTPPPLDESYFTTPAFKKSYTISSMPSQNRVIEPKEENKRESVKSNNSNDESPMVFGSDKQMNFMSKLENIFQTKMAGFEEEPIKRSNSVGNILENTDETKFPERPPMLPDLKKEIILGEVAANLRHIQIEDYNNKTSSADTDDEEPSLSKEDLKSKLESIFATGGPKPMKARLMKSNPPTPEEAYQTDTSSSESIPKIPKMEKNDTLKRQKTKFGEVLNSFRLTLNRDDEV